MMPTLSHFQALLFDVDNTLTQTNKEFDPATHNALQQFINRGYLLGVCTAKCFPILKNKILPHFSPRVLHIGSGGAQIITTEGEVAWEKGINPEVFQKIKTFLDQHQANYFVTGSDVIYAHPSIIEYLQQHPFEPVLEPTSNVNLTTAPLLGIYNVTQPTLDFLDQFKTHLTVKPMTNHRTGRLYVDVTANNVNKAIAFEKWCELSSIRAQEVIGFGDSSNDLEFLDKVGFAVAMGNALPEIKAVADRVIGHTDDNGLATYLYQVLEEGEL